MEYDYPERLWVNGRKEKVLLLLESKSRQSYSRVVAQLLLFTKRAASLRSDVISAKLTAYEEAEEENVRIALFDLLLSIIQEMPSKR